MFDFLIKKFAPQLIPALDKGQVELKKYLDQLPLQGDETHHTVVVDYLDSGEAVLRIAAFKQCTLTRIVDTKTKEDLSNLIAKMV